MNLIAVCSPIVIVKYCTWYVFICTWCCKIFNINYKGVCHRCVISWIFRLISWTNTCIWICICNFLTCIWYSFCFITIYSTAICKCSCASFCNCYCFFNWFCICALADDNIVFKLNITWKCYIRCIISKLDCTVTSCRIFRICIICKCLSFLPTLYIL